MSRTISGIRRANLLFGVLATLLGALSAGLVVRRFVRPLSELTSTLIALPSAGKSVNVPYLGKRDEIGAIARAVDGYRETMTELDERWRQLYFALDNTAQGIVFLDAELRIVLANCRYREIYGYSASTPAAAHRTSPPPWRDPTQAHATCVRCWTP